jgi:hypothetical protein
MAQRHAHRDGRGQFTPVPVPNADTSVVNLSGDPLGEHDRPGDATVYPPHDPRSGPATRRIPQRRAVLIDADGQRTEHDYDREARGADTLYNGGHFRAQAHVMAAQGDPLITSLVSPVRSPAAHARGRAAYRAAIERTGVTTQHDGQGDPGQP